MDGDKSLIIELHDTVTAIVINNIVGRTTVEPIRTILSLTKYHKGVWPQATHVLFK